MTAQDVIDACEAEWDAHKGDCSGFAKAVGLRLGVMLTGQANDIVDEIRKSPWSPLFDGITAAASADTGSFVLAALKGTDQVKPDPHGHVVVVVRGQLAHDKYPTAYWGRLGGTGSKDTTLNFAWREGDRDKLVYAKIDVQAVAKPQPQTGDA